MGEVEETEEEKLERELEKGGVGQGRRGRVWGVGGGRGSGGVRGEKKERESRKSMKPQDNAKGLPPKMTWDTLEQVTSGVTADFTLFIVVVVILPFPPILKSKPIAISQLHSGKCSENVNCSEKAQM